MYSPPPCRLVYLVCIWVCIWCVSKTRPDTQCIFVYLCVSLCISVLGSKQVLNGVLARNGPLLRVV